MPLTHENVCRHNHGPDCITKSPVGEPGDNPAPIPLTLTHSTEEPTSPALENKEINKRPPGILIRLRLSKRSRIRSNPTPWFCSVTCVALMQGFLHVCRSSPLLQFFCYVEEWSSFRLKAELGEDKQALVKRLQTVH